MRRYVFRRNVVTGDVEYQEKGRYILSWRPLTQEARNDINNAAIDEGIKVWPQDMDRLLGSSQVADYDPVRDWRDECIRDCRRGICTRLDNLHLRSDAVLGRRRDRSRSQAPHGDSRWRHCLFAACSARRVFRLWPAHQRSSCRWGGASSRKANSHSRIAEGKLVVKFQERKGKPWDSSKG